MTYTLSILKINPASYADIERRLRALGPDYNNMFMRGGRINLNEVAVEADRDVDPSFEAKLRIFLHENTEPSVAGIDRTLVERVIRAWERMK